MEEEHESLTWLHLHAKIRITCAGWGKKKPNQNLGVPHVFRGKQPKGRHREAACEAGWFGGGLDAVTSTSSVLLRGRWGGRRAAWFATAPLEEDAGLLPAQQQPSPACAKVARENPFPSDAVAGQSLSGSSQNPPELTPGDGWQHRAHLESARPQPCHVPPPCGSAGLSSC